MAYPLEEDSMKAAGTAVFLALGFWLIYLPTADAESWRCLQKDGAAVFTDRPKDLSRCEPYSYPPSVIPPETKKNTAPLRPSDGFVSGPEVAYPLTDYSTPARVEAEPFRGVVVGMTESEVLALAGYPNDRYRLPCGSDGSTSSFCPKRWVYADGDKWIVEVTLDTGKVAEIKNYRRR
jgi:hypothetical protein